MPVSYFMESLAYVFYNTAASSSWTFLWECMCILAVTLIMLMAASSVRWEMYIWEQMYTKEYIPCDNMLHRHRTNNLR